MTERENEPNEQEEEWGVDRFTGFAPDDFGTPTDFDEKFWMQEEPNESDTPNEE